MKIALDNSFPLKGVVSNICMLYDDAKSDITTAVIGRIKVRKTDGRETKDLCCGSGFECEKLPFARGHLIALELGGSDNKYNVVPQFARWQNSGGEWRTMEEDIEQHFNGLLMLVEIQYGRVGGAETHEALKAKFAADPFVSWVHPLIPDRFKVSIINDATDPSTLDTYPKFQAALTALKLKPTVKSYPFALPVDGKLPLVDEIFRAREVAAGITFDKYDEEDDAGDLKRAFSAASTYLLAPGKFQEIKEEVKKRHPNLTATTPDSITPFGVMKQMEKGITEAKVRGKLKKKRAAKVGVDEIAAATFAAAAPAAAAPPPSGVKKKAKGDKL